MDSFLKFNRNKRGVAADLKDTAMRYYLLALASDVDVVVENFRLGASPRRHAARSSPRCPTNRPPARSSELLRRQQEITVYVNRGEPMPWPDENWLVSLDAHDAWCAPVQDYQALKEDPQVRHARLCCGRCRSGPARVAPRAIGSPFTFSETPPSLRHGVPRAGQHTEEVLHG